MTAQRHTSLHRVLVVALAILLPNLVHAADLRVVVEAGPHRRESTLVHFPVPPDLATSRTWQLQAENGLVRPLQFAHGEAWFLETSLPAGESRSYSMRRARRASVRRTAPITAQWMNQNLQLNLDGHPVLQYLAHAGRLPRTNIAAIYQRGGYIHPLFTPSGRAVTDDYPPNHIHHHAIWFAWTKTRFDGRTPDFWNMGEGKGRVDFVRFDSLKVGPVFGEFSARQVFTDTQASPPVQVLEDAWRTTVFPIQCPDGPPVHVVELRSEQSLLTDRPLELPKYFYGGLGFRGPWNWNGATNLFYLDSNGETNRVTANGTRARWYWVGGMVEGQLAGLAILGHPDNFRAPQPLRVHPTEPFICWAPSHLGDWSLEPGKPFLSRYRLVAFDGLPKAEILDRLWFDYAEPPAVRITTVKPPVQ